MPINYQLGKVYKITSYLEIKYMSDLLHYLDYALDFKHTFRIIKVGKEIKVEVKLNLLKYLMNMDMKIVKSLY
jgi:hypothetical protein